MAYSGVNHVEEVRQKLDLLDVVSARVDLKKSGRSYKGLCPFHNERTPSFILSPERQNWHCFGCGAGGDVFAFVMKAEGVEFGEALRLLAARAGVTLDFSPRKVAESEERRRLLAANHAAARFFAQQLAEPGGRQAREYLEQRGVRPETVERFGLGYAPQGWDNLLRALTRQGFTPETLAAAGLVSERDGQAGYYDRFRHKLTIPIRDPSGAVLGFGTRVLDDSLPKYINSPQTAIFDKSACLFGIEQAREAIRRADGAVIVEGYFDVILPHQAGVRNVVAAMGTALTDKQMGLLRRYTTRIVLALDADAAGQAATLRGLEMARASFARKTVPVPGPGGRVRYESVPGVDLRVAVLPRGMDPDEVVRSSPAAWGELVGSALPVLEFQLRRVAQAHDLSEARGKAAAFAELVPLLQEIPDRVERAHYLARAADLLRVDAQVLSLQLAQARRELATPRPAPGAAAGLPLVEAPQPPPAPRGEADEEYLLALLLREPGMASVAQSQLQPEDFSQSADRALFQWLGGAAARRWLADEPETLPPELEERADDLGRRYPAERLPEGDLLQREVEVCSASVRLRRVCEELDQLRYIYPETTDDAERFQLRVRQQRLSQERLTIERMLGSRGVTRRRAAPLLAGER